MKVFIAITVLSLLSGAQAGAFLDSLKNIGQGFTDTFSHLATDLKQPLTDVANSLVDNLKTAGTNLLATGAQSLLGSLSHLGESSTSTRDLSALKGVMTMFENGKADLHRLAETLGGLYHAAITRLNQFAQNIMSLDVLKEPLEKVLKDISEVVDLHNIFQNSIMKALSTKGKRGILLDTIGTLEQQIAGLFQPVVNAVQQHVSTLGAHLTQAATDLFQGVTPVLGSLAQNLNMHAQALKDSATELLTDGQNALKALQN